MMIMDFHQVSAETIRNNKFKLHNSKEQEY